MSRKLRIKENLKLARKSKWPAGGPLARRLPNTQARARGPAKGHGPAKRAAQLKRSTVAQGAAHARSSADTAQRSAAARLMRRAAA